MSITGLASIYNYTDVNVTISSTPPIIKNIDPIASQSITENTYTDIPVVVQVYDVDGIGTVRNASSMNITASLSGEDLRYNDSCTRLLNVNATTANYSCTIRMWYWDANSAAWNASVRVNDTSGAESTSASTVFTYGSTTGFVMAPPGISWGSIASTALNSTATEPLRLNNTANKNITSGNLNITGVNLQGLSTTSQYLLANTFRVAGPGQALGTEECDKTGATALENGTSVSITSAGLPRGNNTIGGYFGTTNLTFCMLNVSSGATPQVYSTQNVQRWTVGIVT